MPSLNFASGRNSKATPILSAGSSMTCASRPYSVSASSALGFSSVSQTRRTSAAGVPRTMNGLKLSKVPMALSATSPPFGASGFT